MANIDQKDFGVRPSWDIAEISLFVFLNFSYISFSYSGIQSIYSKQRCSFPASYEREDNSVRGKILLDFHPVVYGKHMQGNS